MIVSPIVLMLEKKVEIGLQCLFAFLVGFKMPKIFLKRTNNHDNSQWFIMVLWASFTGYSCALEVKTGK